MAETKKKPAAKKGNQREKEILSLPAVQSGIKAAHAEMREYEKSKKVQPELTRDQKRLLERHERREALRRKWGMT